MYEFVRGPMMWIAVSTALLGLSYRVFSLVRMTKKKQHKGAQTASTAADDRTAFGSAYCKSKGVRGFLGTLFELDPLTASLTSIFHICLIVTPFFVVGHSVLFLESWSVSTPSLPEPAIDGLTMLFLICAALLLIRRFAVSEVRAITTLYDCILMLIVIAPFASGFLAYRQVGDYEKVIIAHMLSGELLLISLGLTKLGHMVLFVFSRFFIGSEFSFGRGTRRW